MSPELRKGIEKLLSVLTDGSTGASLNWSDGATNYSVSASITSAYGNVTWNFYVSESPVPTGLNQ